MTAAGPRTLLIGLGRIAFELERDRFRYHPCTHAGSLRAFNETVAARRAFQLVGVCDRKPEQIEAFQRWWNTGAKNRAGKQHGPPAAYDAYRAALENADPELVIIATSVESHAEIALAAMRAGARAILLEKPIGYDAAQARRLLREAEKRGVRVWVNFERRYHPAYRLARRYVQERKFGALRHVAGRVLTGAMRPDPHKTLAYPEGPLLHDAVHWIDLLIWLTGRPRDWQCDLDLAPQEERFGVEDTARVRFACDDFSAYLESGGRRRYFEFTMELDFAEGRIVAGNAGHSYFKSAPSGRYAKFRELRPVKAAWKAANPWLELYREIAGELRRYPDIGPGDYAAATTRIGANLADAVTGMEIIDACYRPLRRQMNAARRTPRRKQ